MTMDVKQLLSTTPETLAERQHAALLLETKRTLSLLMSHLDKGDYQAAVAMLENSPAGDGHGCDNACINFSHVMDANNSGCFTDIGDVIDRLQSLAQHLPKKGARL